MSAGTMREEAREIYIRTGQEISRLHDEGKLDHDTFVRLVKEAEQVIPESIADELLTPLVRYAPPEWLPDVGFHIPT